MKKIFYVPVMAFTFGLAACGSAIKVTSDYDKHADFAKYKTFALDSIRQQSVSNKNIGYIKNAVRAEMKKRGILEDSTRPDMLVNISTVVINKNLTESMSVDYAYGGVYRPYYWENVYGAPNYSTADPKQFKQGSLIIEIIDAAKKSLLWEGIGNAEIDQQPANPEATLKSAVSATMKSFPPKAVNK